MPVRQMSRGVKMAGAVVTATLLLGVMTATPANAEEIHFNMKTDDGNPGGSAHFWPDGDRLTVCDIQHDDDAYVQFSVINVTKDPDVFEYRVEDGGDADCGSHSGWEGQPYQLAEGDCFEFHVWLERSSDHAMIPGSADSAQWRNYNHAKRECPGVD